MPTSAEKYTRGPFAQKKRKGRRVKEVAGPYRSQSSNPKIRSEATAEEHRKVPVKRKGRRKKPDPFDLPKTFTKGYTGKGRQTKQDDFPDLGSALENVADALRNPAEKFTGKSPGREFVEEEAAKAVEAIKQNYDPERVGQPPTSEQVSTLANIAAGVSAGPAARGTEKALSKAASAVSDASWGKTLAEQGAKKVAARSASKAGKAVKARATSRAARIKTAPQRTAKRIKETPQRVRTAPSRTKKALSTRQGRRRVAKRAGRTAVRHPIKTGVPAAAATPPGVLPGDIDERARAFLKGTAAATFNHPGKTLETTAQGALGAFTFPLAVGGAAVKSVKEGSTAPLEKEATGLYEGTKKMVEGLASGDPKRVEQTTLQETGLIPFIPVPHVVRKAKRSRSYLEARGKLRGAVEGKRSKTRSKRIAAETEALVKGEFIPKRKAKKIRQPVEDTARPGENYIFRRTGKLREKQRGRHYVAREVTRMEQEGDLGGRLATESVAKALRKSKGTNQKAQNYGEALRIVAKHGLPADEAKGIAFVKRLDEQWRENEPGDIPAGVHLDRHSTRFILDHPEIFKDPDFWKAVEKFDAQSLEVGTSPRNRYQAQVDNIINPGLKEQGRLPILKPEEMVPEKTAALMRRAVPRRTDRWSRDEVLDYAKDLAEVKGPSRVKALATRKEILDSLDGLMRSPKHGGAEGGVSTTQAVAWTPEMEREFVRQARAAGQSLGLRDPAAYVADNLPSSVKGADRMPDFRKQVPLRKVWPSSGKVARSGNALSDFESVMFYSAEAPRARAAMVRGLERVFDKASRQVGGKRYFTEKQLERAINTRQVPDGLIPVRPQTLRALLEGEDVADPIEFRNALFEEIERGQKFVSSAGDQLRGEMLAAKGAKGEKFALMDATMMQELAGHLEGPSALSTAVGRATNFSTQAILNSPAFEAAQFAQEGIPMAAALGRNVAHVPKAIANLRRIAKYPPDMQAQIRAVVGSSAGLRGAPSIKALRSEGFMNPIRAAGHKTAWRHAWELVNGDKLSRFDRARAGRFREVAAMAKLEGDLRRAEKGFQVWRSSANNLFKDLEKAAADMRGMNPAERIAYATSHPTLADRLQRHMNGLAGNWNSFTVFEKQIAPFAVFYSFQRYSVLWALYHFPLDHPVVASALGMFGAANAQELKRIAATKGAEPNILDYTKPVIAGDTVLPAGQRFFSGLGSIQQAVVEGKPTQALNALSPPFAIGIEALTGKNAYTGQPLDENGWLYAMRQSANLSPFLRFLGVPDIGSSPSAASKAFQALDPLRAERSLVNPYIGQTARQFAEEKKLSQQFDTKYGPGDIPSAFDSELVQELLFGNDGKPKPEMLPNVLREIHKAEAAGDYIERKERPFLGPDSDFTEQQKKLLQAVEDAWQTGPSQKKKGRRMSIGGSGGPIGGYSLGGPIGGSSGGSVGGGSASGIGGYSLK